MKKLLSAAISAVLATAPIGVLNTSAVSNNTSNINEIVIFGDSIAAGYGLEAYEYNYGQICGDYLGCDVVNLAHSGDTTNDMLNVIGGLDNSRKNSVANADVIVISIGGNDMIHYFAKWILNYAAGNGFLNEGYTAADIPEEPAIADLLKMLNINGEGGIKEHSSDLNVLQDFNFQIKEVSRNMRLTDGYDGYIHNHIAANLSEAVSEIKSVNPNARIIVQTIYNPLQIQKEFLESRYGSGSSYITLLGQLRSTFKDILDTCKDEFAAIDGVEIADVYSEFTSQEATQTNAAPGHTYYFTNMQRDVADMDFHPNQKGHLAIAATVLDVIDVRHDDSEVFANIYANLEDKDGYPEIALGTYLNVRGAEPKKTLTFYAGDTNNDNFVDSVDASAVLAEYASLSTSEGVSSFTLSQKAVSDVNMDGFNDSVDASVMLAYYAYASTGGKNGLRDFVNGNI